MTNEQHIVTEIRNGYSVTDHMQLLYENNLPLIKQIIKPYSGYEPVEDLLQESYFGLWDAVKRYETSENVRFMTYAGYWIKQAVQRYIEKCGSVVYILAHTWQKIFQYKKAVKRLGQERGGTPTDAEIVAYIGVPIAEVQKIKTYAQGTASLDTPITEDENITLSDTLKADLCVEDETIDKIYAEHSKIEL